MVMAVPARGHDFQILKAIISLVPIFMVDVMTFRNDYSSLVQNEAMFENIIVTASQRVPRLPQ